MSSVPRRELSETVTTPVEIQYWLFMCSSTECTQDSDPGLGQWTVSTGLLGVPRRDARRLEPAERES
uniref:Uncharacterized protein n=1 Tax=Peronospora matthiolae TaxID=2874970 RepID=A0AAV1UN38_9STRA